MSQKSWLEEQLKKNAEEVKKWPHWMRKAANIEEIKKKQNEKPSTQCSENSEKMPQTA
jgi:hypothetical protein